MPGPESTQETLQERLAPLGQVDIVAGIPSYNNAGTVAHVVEAARDGLQQYFGCARAVIVNADAGSTDGTPEKARAASGGQGFVHLPHPVSGDGLTAPVGAAAATGRAIHTIFQAAQMLGAKGCVVFEPDLRSTTPAWAAAMLRPVLDQQYDLVAPDYQRHKFDAMINQFLVYPVIRALYGRRIRQPMGGDFAFSGRAISDYLAQEAWNSDAARLGIEIWLTTHAICGRFRLCQARLGPRVREMLDPGMDLSQVLARMLGALFQAIERDAAFWQKVRGSEAIPVFGDAPTPAPETTAVDAQKMVDSFRLGYQNLTEVWGLVLSPATMLELKRAARADTGHFAVPDETWVHAVYDFAIGYRLRVINREHLLRAMTPLYLGWAASFVLQTRDAGPDDAERRLERLCVAYESAKPYLISRWRWPERFTP